MGGVADTKRRPVSASEFFAPTGPTPGRNDPNGGGGGTTKRPISYQDWYGGRNLESTESGWNSDWSRRAIQQRDEQEAAAEKAGGDPTKFYNWFQRKDATGVSTWNDPRTKIRAENGKERGLKAGDVFDNGKFVHNLYDAYDTKAADTMLGEFIFNGNQKARLNREEVGDPGAYRRELDRRIGENTDQATHGVQSFKTRERTAELAAKRDKDMGIVDEILTFAAGAGGAAASAAVTLNPWIIGGAALVGGAAALLNQDEFSETVARAEVRAERAEAQGYRHLKPAIWSTTFGEIAMKAGMPLQSIVSGGYDMLEGDVGDSVAEFYAIDTTTGDRKASGAWQALHIGASIPDSFLQFSSRWALGTYQAGLVLSTTGKAMQTGQGLVWSDAEGGWHKFEDKGEVAAAIASIGVDVVQLGVSRGAVTAAQNAKAVATGTKASGSSEWLAAKIDDAWAATPGFTKRGREAREAYRTQVQGKSTRAPEGLAGRRHFFDEQGNAVASRTQAVAFVPSELVRWLPATMSARYKAIRANGGSYAEVSAEDLYAASLKLSGNGGRLRDAMLNAFAEGSEEMFQEAMDTLSYSGTLSAEDIYMAGAYGAASGLGMGIGPMLARAGSDKSMRANGFLLEQIRTGGELTRQEWEERWDKMSDVEKRRASTGTAEQMREVEAIRRTIAEQHRLEVGRNGILGARIKQMDAENALEKSIKQAGPIAESTADAHLLPTEVFATDKEVAAADASKQPLMERPVFVSDAAAMTANRMVGEYDKKLKALDARHKMLKAEIEAAKAADPNDPGLPAMQQQLLEIELQQKLVRSIRGYVANQQEAIQSQSDEEVALTMMRKLNFNLRRAAIDGDWKGVQIKDAQGNMIDPTDVQVRNAARLMFSRHPFIEAGSYFSTVPQVHPQYQFENMHGSIGVGIWMAKAAQLDFDGDTLPSLHQVVFDEQNLLLQEVGSQFLEKPDKQKDGEPYKWWKINIDRPADEKEIFSYVYEITRGKRSGRDPRFRALRVTLTKWGAQMSADYGALLKPSNEVPRPFWKYWEEFLTDFYAGNEKAVEIFLQKFVDHEQGDGGQRLVDAGSSHRPRILNMQQDFTVGLMNVVRTMKQMDPILFEDVDNPLNTDPIPETNRRYFKQLQRRDAATTSQSVQAMYGAVGERASQHLAYAPWLQYAINLMFMKPGDHLTAQEQAFMREFFLIAGPGRAESQSERIYGKDITVRRAQDWVASMGDAIVEGVHAKTITLDLLPHRGLEFLAAGMIAPGAETDKQGNRTFRPAQGDKDRRSDISIAQMVLGKSVEVDKARHRTTRKDDPIHSNLNRLGNLAKRKGPKSVQNFRALRELYGDVPPEQLLGSEVAKSLGNMTMNDILAMFRTMDSDAINKQIEKWKKTGGHYTYGSKSDAPWTLEQVQKDKITPYTLFIDTIAAVARTEGGEFATRDYDSIGPEVRGAVRELQKLRERIKNNSAYRQVVREYFGLPKNAEITDEIVSDYLMYNEAIVADVMHLFSNEARAATFVVQSGIPLTADRKWVGEFLIEQNPDRAELMLIVEQAIDLLNARGARINRDDNGKIVVEDARPIDQRDKLESRLAILINELAMQPSSVELGRFMAMYQKHLEAGTVRSFFDEINAQPNWRKGQTEFLPYTDSIKDFETDPRDLWNSGTMNTERLENLRGLSDRLGSTTKTLDRMIEKTSDDTTLIARMEAQAAGRANDAEAQKALEQLKGWIDLRVVVAPTFGSKMRTATMVLANKQLDQSDKAAADARLEALGNAYVLGTSVRLQPALMAEFSQATVLSSDAVLQNPDILMRGPSLVQTDNGSYVAIDLTSTAGFLRAYKDVGMRPLIDMAVFGVERDLNMEGGLGTYSEFSQKTSLSDKLLEGPNRVVFSGDDNLTEEQADYIIGSIEGHCQRQGEVLKSDEVTADSFLPIQRLLNQLMQEYTTLEKWESKTEDDEIAAAVRAKVKVATLLLKMSRIKGEGSFDLFAQMLEADFVARWQQAEFGMDSAFLDQYEKIGKKGATAQEKMELQRQYIESVADTIKQETIALGDQGIEHETRKASLAQAIKDNDTQEIQRLRTEIANSGLTDEGIAAAAAQQQRNEDKLNAFALNSLTPTRGMITYHNAFESFDVQNGDISEEAQTKRYRLMMAIDRYVARAGGKAMSYTVREFVKAVTADSQALLMGNVERITDAMWQELAIVAAKQAVADYTNVSGSTIMFATNPSLEESDGFFYWDETRSYLARPLVNQHVRAAVQWFGEAHKTGPGTAADAVKYATTSGPFAKDDFGKWNPILPGVMVNMQKAMEGASAKLAVPIGGNLPKTQFDAAVASYSDWGAPVLPEHLSTMEVTLTNVAPTEPFRPSNFRWYAEDLHRPQDPAVQFPLGKLHMHFVKNFDFSDVMQQVEAFYNDDERLIQYVMKKHNHGRQTAEAIVAGYRRSGMVPVDHYDWINEMVDEVRGRLESCLLPPTERGAHAGYLLFDAERATGELAKIADMTGMQSITFKVEYVDIDKKPFNDEYRNHGMFDGVGRRAQIDVAISPWGALFFGVAGLSKQIQQAVFDYVARGGTSYKPYYPSGNDAYAVLERQAATRSYPVTSYLRSVTAYIMGVDFKGQANLIPDDWNAVYKMIVGRTIYKGKDPSGVERLMWAEEVIALEQDPANKGWASSKLERIPLNEETFNILHGANTMQAGNAITRPEWDIDRIDKNPSLDRDRLISLGLGNLGQMARQGSTELSTVIALPKRNRLTPDEAKSARTTIRKSIEQRVLNRRLVDKERMGNPGEEERIAKNRNAIYKLIKDDLSPEHIQSLRHMVGMDTTPRDSASMRKAQDEIKKIRDSSSSTDKLFYITGGTPDLAIGRLDRAGAQSMTDEAFWPAYGDGVAINLLYLLDEYGKDEDSAFEEATQLISVLAKRGVKIILTAPGDQTFLGRVTEFMEQNQSFGYTRADGTRYVWEPVTPENFENATEAAIRSSLTATNTFLARNAHVNLHLFGFGHLVDENAGNTLRPEMLNTPHRQQWTILPTRLSAAKFNRPYGEHVYTVPAKERQEYHELVRDALVFVDQSRDEMRRMASMGWAKTEDGWKEGEERWVPKTNKKGELLPDPKDVSLYKMFEESGTYNPGIRSFDEAYDRLLITLQSGNLPLYDNQTGNMAGDFVVMRDRKGRMYFHRLGFEVPGIEELDAMFADGRRVSVAPAKLDESTVVPFDFTVKDSQYDPRGGNYLIEATLSTWSKIVMEGDALKYTVSPALRQWILSDVMAGQNGRDVTFLTSAAAADGKMSYSHRGTRLKGIWAITGMDEVRLPLVRLLSGEDFKSTTDKGFDEAWDSLLTVLKIWAQGDHGLTEQQIRERMSNGMLFMKAELDLSAVFSDAVKLANIAGMNIQLPQQQRMTDAELVEWRIVQVYLGTLLAPRIQPEHITSTPGVWTIKNPMSSEAYILDMPDMWSDTLQEDPAIRKWFVERANARIQKFPPGHEMAGKSVAFFDENLRMFYAVKNRSNGKWMYIEGWADINFPVHASQNSAIYGNSSLLGQNPGSTPHVAAVLSLSRNGRMVEKAPKPGKRDPLDDVFITSIPFSGDVQQDLSRVLKLHERGNVFKQTDRAELLQIAEVRRIKAAKAAFKDFDYRVKRKGPEWKDKNKEINNLIREIANITGISNTNGGLNRMLDKMVRMYFGYPGPIGRDQLDYTEHVTPDDYVLFLGHAIRQLKKNHDPMAGGAINLVPPEFAYEAFKAGKWRPSGKDFASGKQQLAVGWDNTVRAFIGQWLKNGQDIESMFSEEFDGLFAEWKDMAKVLDGMGLSLDMVRDLVPKNRQLNEELHSIDAITQAAVENPLVLDAWDSIDLVFKGAKNPAELYDLRHAKISRVEHANRQRRQYMAKNEVPGTLNKKMKSKDYMQDGAAYISRGTSQNRLFSAVTNWSHIMRLLDFNIFASGYLEQPHRMMYEHLTDLLTGSYTGRGAGFIRGGWLQTKLSESNAGKRAAKSEMLRNLGFGTFGQTFTAEDQRMLDTGAQVLGDDTRWLAVLQEDTEYMNVVLKAGKSKFERGLERGAATVARTMSDPLYGSTQRAVAKRYLTGVIESLHSMGEDISIPGLVDALRKDPLYLQKQYGDIGLTPHRAGMNRVLQVRSQKQTLWSRFVGSSINSLIASPNRLFKLGGHVAAIPFAYTRYAANGLQFITGMDGWAQAASMFFAGRRRPKFLLRGGVNGNPDYWDLEDTLETMDLGRTFVRSGATLSMLFTLGLLAGGKFGFLGEDEEETRRRKQAMYMGLVDVKDPNEPENNFLYADAVFLDSVPGLSTLYKDESGNSAIVPHWVIRQFTSPILGFSRFWQTGDFREVGYGFLDAFTAVPNSIMRLYKEADMTAGLLWQEAQAASEEGTEEAQSRANRLLITAVGVLERALMENQMANTLYSGLDKYDRDPWAIPMEKGTEGSIGPDGLPMPTEVLNQYKDPETGLVENSYATRMGRDGQLHQYAENNLGWGLFMFVVSGFDSSYFRQNMVAKRRSIDLGETEIGKAEAAVYGLFSQENGLIPVDGETGRPISVEGLTQKEIEFALKDAYRANDVWWEEDKIQEEARALYESGDLATGALSFMGPNGEAVTKYGADRIIQSIYKGTTRLGSPELVGVSISPEMRKELEVVIKQRLLEDGLKLGLPQKTAEYRAKRIWYGDDDNPDDVGMRDILWSDQIPYSSKVEYNQLNVMYMIGPDGKPWATPFERKTLGQAFLPFPHKQAPAGPGMSKDSRGMMIDEVLGINTGLAAIERIPQTPIDLEPDDEAFKISDQDHSDDSARRGGGWRRYGRGGYGRRGGGGGGGGGFARDMRPLPSGQAARFDGLQFINTSNPIIRRADVNRMRIWTERGRLKQWQ